MNCISQRNKIIVGAESKLKSICTEAPKGAYQFKDKSFDVALRTNTSLI